MKYISIMTVCIAVVLMGLYKASTLKNKAFLLKKLSVFFTQFGDIAASNKINAIDIVARISAMDSFSCFPFLNKIQTDYYYGSNLNDLWRNAVNNSNNFDCLSKDEKLILADFSAELSKASYTNIQGFCESYSTKFEELSQQAIDYSKRTGKLCVSSGVLGAAFIFVLLI